jgi:hypothetical protein
MMPKCHQDGGAGGTLELQANEEARAQEAEMNAKRCEICDTRPIMPGGRMLQVHGVKFPYCEPCLVEADWENTHSDYGHDVDGPEADDYTTAGAHVTGCWVCNPELNEASATYTPRTGVSRKGQVINVTIRATGRTKATEVAEKFNASYKVTVSSRKGFVTLKAASANETFVLVWDAQGHFQYGPSTYGSRKVRNVAEALRLAA